MFCNILHAVPKCPFCNHKQIDQPVKSWAYGKMIEKRTNEGTIWGASVNCSQYYCKCGKQFRFYLSTKGKSWTIPKLKVKTNKPKD